MGSNNVLGAFSGDGIPESCNDKMVNNITKDVGDFYDLFEGPMVTVSRSLYAQAVPMVKFTS
uniref:Uncharacterized protein n=2 Tax=Oryza TaxID=4527 RepID=A0A0E0Q7S8_ORYRU